jgi:hypothetical protein
MRKLRSVREVLDELGGNTAVARMLNYSTHRVAMWLGKGSFPSNTYVVMRKALSGHRATAPDTLWKMVERADK